MLITVKSLAKILNVKPQGVVHVGANKAEERNSYLSFGWKNILWIDALTENVEYITKIIDPKTESVFRALIWSESDLEKDFKITSNIESSSVLDFGSHSKNYPDVVVEKIEKMKTTRLDQVIPSSFNFDFLNLDIQGAELEALKSLGTNLNQLKYVYTEVNLEEVYKGCALVNEIDFYLAQYGFNRILTFWSPAGWGDALYIHKDLTKHHNYFRILILKLLISIRSKWLFIYKIFFKKFQS